MPRVAPGLAALLFASSSAAFAAAPPSVRLEKVHFEADGGTLYVEAALEPAALSGRERPVYLGVTAVTPDGVEIDLMVNELFPGALDAPVVFYAEVGSPVQDVLVGAWDTKVQPCEVDRSGCKQFGFVLDGPLASWPPGLYDQGIRQRIPPETVRLRIDGARGDTRKVWRATSRALAAELEPFDASLDVSRGADPVAAGSFEVLYAHPHDRYLAERVAAALRVVEQRDATVLRADLNDAELAVRVGAR